MTEITQAEFDELERFSRGFQQELKRIDPEGPKKFVANTGFFEKIGLLSARLRDEWAKNADPSTRADRLVTYCDKAVPGLVKTFGQQVVIDALKSQSPTEETLDIVDELGGKNLAPLLRLAQFSMKK